MGKQKILTKKQKQTHQKTKKVQKKPKYGPEDGVFSLFQLQNLNLVLAQFPIMSLQKGKKAIGIPKYRLDRHDFTPGFSLPDDFNRSYVKSHQFLHECKVQSETTEVDVEQIQSPRPSQRSNYCIICKVKFEDYFAHIRQEEHVTRMRGSYYNRMINELCDKFRIQRFFKDSEMKQQTITEQKLSECATLFFQEQNLKQIKKCNGDVKQHLYELIKQQCRNQLKEVKQINTVSVIEDNIYDVLQF